VGALRLAFSKGRFNGPPAGKTLLKRAIELKTDTGRHHPNSNRQKVR
jgi:hypothetical protein